MVGKMQRLGAHARVSQKYRQESLNFRQSGLRDEKNLKNSGHISDLESRVGCFHNLRSLESNLFKPALLPCYQADRPLQHYTVHCAIFKVFELAQYQIVLCAHSEYCLRKFQYSSVTSKFRDDSCLPQPNAPRSCTTGSNIIDQPTAMSAEIFDTPNYSSSDVRTSFN